MGSRLGKVLLWTGVVILVGITILGRNFAPSETELVERYVAMGKLTNARIEPTYLAEAPYLMPIFGLWDLGLRLPNLLLAIPIACLGTGLLVMPWFWNLMVFNLPGLWSLFLGLAVLGTSRTIKEKRLRNVIIIFLLLFLSMSSFSGIFLSGILAFNLTLNKRIAGNKLSAFILGVFLIGFGIWVTGGFNSSRWFWKDMGLTESNLMFAVDQRAKFEYQLNNFNDVIPLKLKRISYNKLVFGYLAVGKHFSEMIDFEKWSYPGQADTTISKNLWSSKELSFLPFWVIPLALWGIYKGSKSNKEWAQMANLFLIWGVVASFFGKSGSFLINGTGLYLGLSMWAFLGIRTFNNYLKVPIIGLIIWSGLMNYAHFVGHEEYWRDNRPMAQLTMARMIENRPQATPGFVTTILGRSFLYYAWIGKMEAGVFWNGVENSNTFDNIVFDHFDLNRKSNASKGIYVGLPGEFIGNKKDKNDNGFVPSELPGEYKLLESYITHDTVSFGNGDYIWKVEIK